MQEPLFTYRTKTGRVLTDTDIEALAEEAERGYKVDPKNEVEIRRYGAGSGRTIPRFFRSALFPLIVIIVGVFIASRFIGG